MLGHELLVKLYRHGVLNRAVFPPLAAWLVQSFFSGAVSGWIVASLHRKHRNAMLLTLAGALLVWASMLRGWFLSATVASEFVMVAITFYVFAMAGVFIGGFLVRPTPNTGPPPKARQSPAC